jgi:hypothetical protein
MSAGPYKAPMVRKALRESDAFLNGKVVSPWITALRYEYEKAGLHQWSNAKVYQCCQIFRCTLPELCALAGLFDPVAITRYRSRNLWPIYLTIQFDKLVKFKLGMREVHVQDALAAKGLVWDEQADVSKDLWRELVERTA